MPLVQVSVLMSVYNTSFFESKRAINSVLNQDFTNFELIILDDGSNLELSLQLFLYCQQNEQKLTYMRHSNRGQSATINRGVSFSKGQYIAFIDADDEYKPNHLSTCLAQMEQFDLVSTLTDTIVSDESDYYIPDYNDPTKNIHVDECFPFATLFGKKEVFQRFPFKKLYGADLLFFEQAATEFKAKKIHARTYVYYRNNANSVTALLKTAQLELTNLN
jgi:glycosyltransferase involved in cell wall biosynthesis